MTNRLNIVFIVIIGVFLNACSIQPVPTDTPQYRLPLPESLPVSGSPTTSSQYWWYARFKMVWSEEPDSLEFANDLIIAHQIINPVLQNHHQTIRLWRFHRRAAKDSAGHQFSFIFYTNPESAREIFQQIRDNPLSQQLITEGIVEKIRLDNPDKPKRPAVEDTSDKNWPLTIQKSWPYYIMGVSILWLDLLNQQAALEQLDRHRSLQSQMQQYEQINEQISQQWKTQGGHAFFHHISAIFAYDPLEIRF